MDVISCFSLRTTGTDRYTPAGRNTLPGISMFS